MEVVSYEKKRAKQNLQCKGELHTQIQGGVFPPSYGVIINKRYKDRIILLCKKCEQPISNYKSLSRRFCDDCKKKTKYEGVKRWRKKHPEKIREHERRKVVKNTLKRGGSPHSLVENCVDCRKDISDRNPNAIRCEDCSIKKRKKDANERSRKRDWKTYGREKRKYKGKEIRWKITNCIVCGKDISDRFANAKYCEKCSKDVKNFRSWYHAIEVEGRDIVKKSMINRCIRCGRDISMYDAQSVLCSHCKEGKLNNIGTTNFSSHLRYKRYKIPDWKKEQQAVENQMRRIGLK